MLSKETEEAKKKALRWLSHRPRTEAEIYFRLKQHGFSQKAISGVIDYLKEYDYLDDRAFARQWVRYRLENKKKSKGYLYLELVHKGVPESLASEAVESITEEEEYNIAVEQARKKLKRGCSRLAIGRYLERQGFPSGMVYKVYRSLTRDTPDDYRADAQI
jgi:regulatory protein